jgi:hypothetical protein
VSVAFVDESYSSGLYVMGALVANPRSGAYSKLMAQLAAAADEWGLRELHAARLGADRRETVAEMVGPSQLSRSVESRGVG